MSKTKSTFMQVVVLVPWPAYMLMGIWNILDMSGTPITDIFIYIMCVHLIIFTILNLVVYSKHRVGITKFQSHLMRDLPPMFPIGLRLATDEGNRRITSVSPYLLFQCIVIMFYAVLLTVFDTAYYVFVLENWTKGILIFIFHLLVMTPIIALTCFIDYYQKNVVMSRKPIWDFSND